MIEDDNASSEKESRLSEDNLLDVPAVTANPTISVVRHFADVAIVLIIALLFAGILEEYSA